MKEISTEELLKQATPRPWRYSTGFQDGEFKTLDLYGSNITRHGKTLCGFALAKIRFDQVGDAQAQANAETIFRAVNSFEAMREALKGADSDIQSVKQAMNTPDAWDRCETLLGTTQEILRKALALAEGKAVQS